jgi:outer membrane lipoprotein SlyB
MNSGVQSIDGVPVDTLKAKRPNRLLPIVGGTLIGAAVGLATGSIPGVLVGAGIGGGVGAGASYSKKGSEVSIKEDDLFEIELKKEVVLPVLDY